MLAIDTYFDCDRIIFNVKNRTVGKNKNIKKLSISFSKIDAGMKTNIVILQLSYNV